jgi:AcrR family transcriptional regulator
MPPASMPPSSRNPLDPLSPADGEASAPDGAASKPGENKRWTRRKDARPTEIIDAALELFVEKGYANTRGEDVAARAGISKGTMYLYFANKEELFKAVVRQNILPAMAEASELIEHYEGPTAALVGELLRGWWERIGATKAAGISKLMMAESGNFPEIFSFYFDEVIEPGHRMFANVLQRGIDRGEFRAMDVEATVHSLIAPILLLMMWQHSGTPCDFRVRALGVERHLDALIELAVHGLAKRPAP